MSKRNLTETTNEALSAYYKHAQKKAEAKLKEAETEKLSLETALRYGCTHSRHQDDCAICQADKERRAAEAKLKEVANRLNEQLEREAKTSLKLSEQVLDLEQERDQLRERIDAFVDEHFGDEDYPLYVHHFLSGLCQALADEPGAGEKAVDAGQGDMRRWRIYKGPTTWGKGRCIELTGPETGGETIEVMPVTVNSDNTPDEPVEICGAFYDNINEPDRRCQLPVGHEGGHAW